MRQRSRLAIDLPSQNASFRSVARSGGLRSKNVVALILPLLFKGARAVHVPTGDTPVTLGLAPEASAPPAFGPVLTSSPVFASGHASAAEQGDSCLDTDSGALDKTNKGCDMYAKTTPSDCGLHDDADFSAAVMCCACNGGTTKVDKKLDQLVEETFLKKEEADQVAKHVSTGSQKLQTFKNHLKTELMQEALSREMVQNEQMRVEIAETSKSARAAELKAKTLEMTAVAAEEEKAKLAEEEGALLALPASAAPAAAPGGASFAMARLGIEHLDAGQLRNSGLANTAEAILAGRLAGAALAHSDDFDVAISGDAGRAEATAMFPSGAGTTQGLLGEVGRKAVHKAMQDILALPRIGEATTGPLVPTALHVSNFGDASTLDEGVGTIDLTINELEELKKKIKRDAGAVASKPAMAQVGGASTGSEKKEDMDAGGSLADAAATMSSSVLSRTSERIASLAGGVENLVSMLAAKQAA